MADAGTSRGALDAVSRLATPKGILLAAGAAAPLLLVPLGPGALWSAASGALGAVAYAMVADQVAHDRPGLPPLRGDDGVLALRRGTRSGLMLFAIGVLPFVSAVALGSAAGDASLARLDVLAAMLVTSLYMPPAIVAVLITNNPLAALWPLSWMRVIGAGPIAYLRLLVTYALGMACVWGATSGIESVLHAPPALAAFASGVVGHLVWMGQAALVGAFVRTNASALAFGGDD